MKRIYAVAFIALSLLLAGCVSHASPTSSPTSSAVEVIFHGGHGSGVYLGHGLVATAKHIVDAAHGGVMVVRDQRGEFVTADAKWVSQNTDVAVLRLRSPLHVAASPLASNAPSAGTRITVVGNPLGGKLFAARSGKVLSSEPIDMNISGGTAPQWHDALQISIALAPGDSGGPAYDANGKVVGIVVGSLNYQNYYMYYMITAREVAPGI